MSTLGNLLKSNLSNQTDTVEAHSQLIKAIDTYISSQVTTTGTFVGALVSPPNTPGTFPSTNMINTTSLSTIILSVAPDPSNSGGSAQWMQWMISLYTAIRSTCFISTGPAIPMGMIPAFSLLITPSWSQKDLGGVLDKDDPFSEGMEIMASNIIKDLQAGFTPSFPSSFGGGYQGVTNITKINCP